MFKYFFATAITIGVLLFSAYSNDPEKVFSISTNALVIFYLTVTIVYEVENRDSK